MKAAIFAAMLALPLAAQDFAKLQVDRVVWGFTFLEGPVWQRDGFLVFSDVPSSKIYWFKPGQKPAVLQDDSHGGIGNAVDSKGRLYSCESHNRRVVRTNTKGDIEVLAEKWQGKRLNAPNDIVVRKDGHAWFTDPAFGSQQDTRELDFYGVYHLSPAGALNAIAKPRSRPNGIALSPDGKTLYVTNSDERNVRAYSLDHKGEASAERVLISGLDGVPGGIRTDENGNLYIAARNLLVYSPEGQPLATIRLDEKPSNCAFGDPDLRSLYITARASLYRVRMPVKGWTPYQSE